MSRYVDVRCETCRAPAGSACNTTKIAGAFVDEHGQGWHTARVHLATEGTPRRNESTSERDEYYRATRGRERRR